MDDFEYARDRVLMGPKREEVLERQGKADDRLSRIGACAVGLDRAGRRSRAQGDDHSPRPLAGRHATAARGRPAQHRRIGAARPAVLHAGRPGGRKAGLRRVQRRGRKRPDAGHAAGPADGHGLGHERAARAGRLSHQRRASLPGQGNLRAARVQRAQRAVDRRRSRPHPARGRRPGHASC